MGIHVTTIYSVHPVHLSSSTSFLYEFARVSHMDLHKFLT